MNILNQEDIMVIRECCYKKEDDSEITLEN